MIEAIIKKLAAASGRDPQTITAETLLTDLGTGIEGLQLAFRAENSEFEIKGNMELAVKPDITVAQMASGLHNHGMQILAAAGAPVCLHADLGVQELDSVATDKFNRVMQHVVALHAELMKAAFPDSKTHAVVHGEIAIED
jgi:hypothetical protein